ncbi:DUF4417 domain-containing protein [Ramlibacter humi]|uniref:DUF4417 domain-containing protein n=1 Tax=Ramlibacter humi TaxID=2530451 RepID=A0A4Z0CE93_9BURK|nr:DUF4417 domain-containing protein [Ramlibacter humi]TFZ08938.1 hypothetical protein EZ216_07290 [Ramlibacter humi]
MLEPRHHQQVWAIKDQSSGQPLLGCGTCLDRPTCGGLHTANGGADAISCMSMCRCEDPERCHTVCPKAPVRYAHRVWEVGGFELDDIPLAPAVPLPPLPGFIPLWEGNVVGKRAIRDLNHVAFPLSMALRGGRQLDRAKNAAELRRSFGAQPIKGWIASGVERDPKVERIWRLPEWKKAFALMHRAGVIFATSPNYSTYADVPRHDNLHAIKRIAWTWYHMVNAGLPTALHLNGRTDHDFERWAEFAKRQVNLKAVAFEFLTGAKPLEDGARYVQRLIRFVQLSGRRDLVLVRRGGQSFEDELKNYFAQVVTIDSDPYFKTVKRQRLTLEHSGALRARKHRTASAAQMRELLTHNTSLKAALHMGTLQRPAQGELEFLALAASGPAQCETDDEASQFDLFAG